MWETLFPTHWSLGITVDLPRGEPGLPSIWVECQSELTWAPDGPLRCDLFIMILTEPSPSTLYQKSAWSSGSIDWIPKPFHGTCSIALGTIQTPWYGLPLIHSSVMGLLIVLPQGCCMHGSFCWQCFSPPFSSPATSLGLSQSWEHVPWSPSISFVPVLNSLEHTA